MPVPIGPTTLKYTLRFRSNCDKSSIWRIDYRKPSNWNGTRDANMKVALEAAEMTFDNVVKQHLYGHE
jgi:tRNA(Ile2) C34 agmatinyltransferase TiaS